ncbi:MAG: tetratricopeptide repeat protein [Promethearchaeota archaeon]
MGLQELNQLFDQNKFKEFLEAVDNYRGEERLEAEIWKATIFLDHYADYEQATVILENVAKKIHDNPRLQIQFHLTKSLFFQFEGNPHSARYEVETAQHIWDTLSAEQQAQIPYYSVYLLFYRSLVYSMERRYDQAINLYVELLHLVSTTLPPIKTFIAAAHLNVGENYLKTGKYDQANNSFKKCITISQEIGNKVTKALAIYNLGEISLFQGELELAEDNFLKSLELVKKVGHQRELEQILSRLGRLYYSRNDFDTAQDYFEQSLAHAKGKTLWYESDVCMTLFQLCQLSLDKQKPVKAKEYLMQLQELSQAKKTWDGEHLCQLAEVRILMRSKRFKEKAQAQTILRHLLANNQVDKSLRVHVLLTLCELLLQEIQAFGDAELFQEVVILIGEVRELAQTWHFIPILIESLIVQSKLVLIQGDAQYALELLKQSEDLAREKGLRHVMKNIQGQQVRLKTELTKWRDLAERNAPLQERLELADLEKYMQNALKIIKAHE